MPYLTPNPSSPFGSPGSKAPDPVSRAPNRKPVSSGRNSRLRLRDRSDRPSTHAELRELAGHAPRDRRPRLRLRLVADDADDLEAPAMTLSARPRRIAQALERDPHLRGPAVRHDLAAGVEQRVPGLVAADAELSRAAHAAAAAAPTRSAAAPRGRRAAARPREPGAAVGVHEGIALHAVAVDLELIRALLVEERVEQHRHAVVAADLLAVGPIDAHHLGPGVVGVEGEVEMVAVVRHPHLGLLRAGRALDGRDLDEVRDVGGGLPDRVVEPAVDLRRRAGPPDDRRGAGWRRRREPSASPGATGALGTALGRRVAAGRRPPERERAGHVPLGLGVGSGWDDKGRGPRCEALGECGGRSRLEVGSRRHAGRRYGRVARRSGQSPGERRAHLVLEVEQVAEIAIDAGAERNRAG